MSHTHNMKPSLITERMKVYKCSSCQFRCTKAKLAEVEAMPKRHRIVRKTDPQAKLVYGKDYG